MTRRPTPCVTPKATFICNHCFWLPARTAKVISFAGMLQFSRQTLRRPRSLSAHWTRSDPSAAKGGSEPATPGYWPCCRIIPCQKQETRQPDFKNLPPFSCIITFVLLSKFFIVTLWEFRLIIWLLMFCVLVKHTSTKSAGYSGAFLLSCRDLLGKKTASWGFSVPLPPVGVRSRHGSVCEQSSAWPAARERGESGRGGRACAGTARRGCRTNEMGK